MYAEFISPDPIDAYGITLSGSDLYFLDGSSNVYAVPKSGGTIRVVASGRFAPGIVAPNADGVAWTDERFPGRVLWKPEGGEIAELFSGRQTSSLARAGDALFWTEVWDDGGADGRVVAFDLKTGVTRELATASRTPGHVAVSKDVTRVVWTEWNIPSVYETPGPADSPDGAIMTASLDGGAPRVLVDGVGPRRLALNDTHVFWSEDHGKIQKAPLDGRGPVILVTECGFGTRFVVADNILYCDGYGPGLRDTAIRGIPVDGGETETIVALQAPIILWSADDTHVYYVSERYLLRAKR